jgi:hypothetical protein
MTEPRELADDAERDAPLPAGEDERFQGYGVMGLPFLSGDLLAMRRWPASSIGPPYTSVWHRDPDGSWTFWHDVDADQGCARYFGEDVDETRTARITLDWTGPLSLHVEVHDDDTPVDWSMDMAGTAVTRVLNSAGAVMPDGWWRNDRVLSLMGRVAGGALRAGPVRMQGHASNGQHFQANPKVMWVIPESHAEVGGRELGPLGPAPTPGRLGDFRIPQRGVFVMGRAFFEPFDPDPAMQ